jgi:hypothetical protein
MVERKNTVVRTFNPTSQKISVYDIHKWIHDTLKIPEREVKTIQIDGPKRQVYIKMEDFRSLHTLLRDMGGQAKYKHNNRTITIVNLDVAGMGTKAIRVANSPPELPDKILNPTEK